MALIKLSKKQQANNTALSILRGLASHAASINNVLEKGVDDNGQKLPCSSDDIKKAFSAEQMAAVEQVLENFYEPPPAPPKPPGMAKGRNKPLHPLPAGQ
jgi:hypothetical protein